MYFTAEIGDEHILRMVRSVMELCGATESATRAAVAFCDEESVGAYAGRMKCVVLCRNRQFTLGEKYATLAKQGELVVLGVPFSIDKLVRIASGDTVARAEQPEPSGVEPVERDRIAQGDTVICEGRFITYGEETVELTERELMLFEYLYKRAGKIVSREELLRDVWKRDTESNVVDVYASYLRRKLDLILPPGSLSAVRGAGYVLKI